MLGRTVLVRGQKMSSDDWGEFAVCIPLALANEDNHLMCKILKYVLVVPELLAQHAQANEAGSSYHSPRLDIVVEGLQQLLGTLGK